jgi:hypothetical protein
MGQGENHGHLRILPSWKHTGFSSRSRRVRVSAPFGISRAAIRYSDNEIPCIVCMVLQYSAPIIVVFQFLKC